MSQEGAVTKFRNWSIVAFEFFNIYINLKATLFFILSNFTRGIESDIIGNFLKLLYY